MSMQLSERRREYPPFRYDGNGTKARIGKITISSSIVMESEMTAMAARGVSIHSDRMPIRKVSVAGIEEMVNSPDLERVSRSLGSAPIDILLFGGTSASFLHGTSFDEALKARIAGWVPDLKVTTTATSMLRALKYMKVGPVALATPYIDEVHAKAVNFLSDNGHPVLSSRNLGISEDRKLAEVPLEDVYDLVCSVDVPEASAIFISCTNFWSVGILEALEEELGKPVISACQAAFWNCLETLDVNGARSGYGSLLDSRVAEGE